MGKKLCLFLACTLLFSMYPISFVSAGENTDASACYIATTDCPKEYIAFAEKNISKYVLSMDESLSYNMIEVGTPFCFADYDADIYYFPVVCDGVITYLFRVYPDGDTFSAAITRFLASDIDNLASLTSSENPMYLHQINAQLVATIGEDSYVLFEYPEEISESDTDISPMSVNEYSTVDAKESFGIELNLRQTRDVSKYINLEITETQSTSEWCAAYCLATIIRTLTNYSPTASTCMTLALGAGNYTTSTTFPRSKMAAVANQYGLYPTVSDTTVSNSVLISQLNNNRPVLVSMKSGSSSHAVVLRGYSTLGTWGIWNPWYSYYENYSMTGTYVPTGASSYSFTPYRHAYNF